MVEEEAKEGVDTEMSDDMLLIDAEVLLRHAAEVIDELVDREVIDEEHRDHLDALWQQVTEMLASEDPIAKEMKEKS